MPFVPVPSTLQANVRFTLDGQQIESVLCFSWLAGTFATASVGIYDILELAWWGQLRSWLSNRLVHNSVYMVDLTADNAGVATFPQFVNEQGLNDIDAVPNNAALCVTHRTANRGKSYRGRTYVSGIPENAVVGSRVASASVTGIVGAFTALRTTAAENGYPFMIVSRYTGGNQRVLGIRTPVTASLCLDDVIDSQRRRLPGRGR